MASDDVLGYGSAMTTPKKTPVKKKTEDPKSEEKALPVPEVAIPVDVLQFLLVITSSCELRGDDPNLAHKATNIQAARNVLLERLKDFEAANPGAN